jgi:hypothetical protein
MNLSALIAVALLTAVDTGAAAPAAKDQASSPACAGAPAAASPAKAADARPAPRICALRPRAKAAGTPSKTMPLAGQDD